MVTVSIKLKLLLNKYDMKNKKGFRFSSEALCGRGGIRTPGTLSSTLVFKTSALNQLCHSSVLILLATANVHFVFGFQKIKYIILLK